MLRNRAYEDEEERTQSKPKGASTYSNTNYFFSFNSQWFKCLKQSYFTYSLKRETKTALSNYSVSNNHTEYIFNMRLSRQPFKHKLVWQMRYEKAERNIKSSRNNSGDFQKIFWIAGWIISGYEFDQWCKILGPVSHYLRKITHMVRWGLKQGLKFYITDQR